MSAGHASASHDGSTHHSNRDDGDELPSFTDSDFYLNLEDVQIGPQIGQGAFSKVYLGRYFGELVAVKKQARAERDLEAYLLRELSVLKHYQHENLLQYIGASNVSQAGQAAVFIVTELTEGGDLLGLLLSDQPLGWKLRVSILLDAARALEFLHSKSLIHRDIKSPNMLLDANFRCLIADFGMARQVGMNMTIVGTDAYMAPELMFDEPYGTAADMFSFGMVLWEAVYRQKAGANDFAERRPADRFRLDVDALREGAPEDTPQSLMALAAQLCEYEPDARPTAEEAFLWLEDLTNELADDGCPRPKPIDFQALMPPPPPADSAAAGIPGGGGSSAAASGTAGAAGAAAGSDSADGVAGSSMASSRASRRPSESTTSGGGGGRDGSPPAPPLDVDGSSVLSRDSAHSPLRREGSGGPFRRPPLSPQPAAAAAKSPSPPLSGAASPPPPGTPQQQQQQRGRSRSSSPSRGGAAAAAVAAVAAVGATHAPITRCGYLFKKGKSGLRNWQRRWFVLEGARLIWYKDSKHYPREPRGFLELRGCFIVRGLYLRWKLLSADAAADQEDYNRELSARDAADMEAWLRALQDAIDGADTGEGPAGALERALSFGVSSAAFRTDLPMDEWLVSLGLSHLMDAFQERGYVDFMMTQEMGLTDEDLQRLGVSNLAQRKVLKLAARGLVEPMLSVRISGFFNFGTELVYRLDSEWRFLRASTHFRFQDFEDLHRRLKAAIKDTKLGRLMPPLPQRPTATGVGGVGIRLGTIDHATTMARLQQALNKYVQKVVMLVGTREPFFTMLCGTLDLLPSDPARLPDRNDDFLAKMSERVTAL
ncbi:unnamed protein product [Phaeothamnion confervicola]